MTCVLNNVIKLEADLRARDELVKVFKQKLAEME
jgi:hypothetical protein